jgi:hypothetical protein
MAFAVDCRDSDAYIMPILSKKKEEERERQRQAKKGYWQNELYSLGIESKEKKVQIIQ